MMKRSRWFSVLLLGWALTPARGEDVRLNQIQVVATHNSYHVRPPESLLRLAIATTPAAKEWDYSREPLDRQLDRGVRSFELDLYFVGGTWRVLHVPVFDPISTVETFRQALEVVHGWSKEHPGHVPVSFLLELKEEAGSSRQARPPARSDLLRMDEQIWSVFARDEVLTPDDVRGDCATLFEAISTRGWPTLTESAGKVLFIVHETGPKRDLYLEGSAILEGRAMFVQSVPSAPHASVLVLNDPDDPRITRRVQEGYLVRTRVDTRGRRSEKGRAAGLASGAQILTTDYPLGEFASGEAFELPGKSPARVNPVTGPEDRAGESLVEPISR